MRNLLTILISSLLLLTAVGIMVPYAQAEDKLPVIIGFNGQPDEKLVKAYRGEIKYTYDITPAIAAKVPAGAIEALRANKQVAFVEADSIMFMDKIPNDPYFDYLWGLHNTGQSGGTPDADIDAPEAWDIETGNSDVVIAVIDTGVDYNHPDLAANMWTNAGENPGNGIDDDGNGYIDDFYGWDFVNNDNNPMDGHGHGTHCSGTIAAVGNNGIGVAGVNWNAKIMALKFLSDAGSGSTSDAILAVQYATKMKLDYGVQVIATSNSWGGGGYSISLYNAIATADAAGILFVAAAGNSGLNNDLNPHYPSSYSNPNIIAVAATDRYDALANQPSWASNYGATSVDLAAPGVTILSTTPSNSYSYYSGTSMATPHVSGVVALLKAQNPGITHSEIKDTIMTTVDPLLELSGKMVTGGRLNVYNAFQQGSGQPVANAGVDQTVSDWDNDQVETVLLDGSGSYDPDGGALTYDWTIGGLSIGTTESFEHDFGIGTHTVTLAVTDTEDLTDSDDVVITVNPNMPPQADAGSDQEVTDFDGSGDEIVTLYGGGSYDPDGSIGLFVWTIGIDVLGTGATIAEPFDVGSYTVTLTVTDNAGATDTDTVSVTVLPKPPETVTLSIEDGYDEKSQGWLEDLGVTYYIQESDNIRWTSENGYYTSYTFSDIIDPSASNIESVVISVEHHEDGGFGSGNLLWTVGTGWPDTPEPWGTITAPLRAGKNSEGVDSWDVTGFISNFDQMNAMELFVENNDGRKDTNVDHVFVVVRYTAGPSNDPPFADPQDVTTNEDVAVAITLTGSDPDGDPLTYSIVSGPANGITTWSAPNIVTYTPDPDFWGSDSFMFKVNDGRADSNVATVTITVEPDPDAPVPTADSQSVTTFVNTPLDIMLTGSDPNGDYLTYHIMGEPGHGTLTGTAPDLTYTPGDYIAFDSFTFFVNDGASDSNIATVSIEIKETPPANEMYVTGLSIESFVRKAGRNNFVHAEVVVTVDDAFGNPVIGATVYGHWSDATNDIDTGITDGQGQVMLASDALKNPVPGTLTFTFTVDDIVLDGMVYVPTDLRTISIPW